jgi:hypothetical protein
VQLRRAPPDVAQDDLQGADNTGKRAQISEAERREQLTPLVLRRSKLSASEALLLRKVFPEILALHQDQVWNRLRKRGLLDQEVEDLVQETFFALHNHILEHGFPDSLLGSNGAAERVRQRIVRRRIRDACPSHELGVGPRERIVSERVERFAPRSLNTPPRCAIELRSRPPIDGPG